MRNVLKGKKVAILVADGFEQIELTEPKKALEDAGATTEIVSPSELEVQGWNHDEKADSFSVDMPLLRARSDDYDALLLPGGVRNPDQLRTMTPWPSLKSDLINAGAHWVDRDVVVDDGLITSRKPADIPAFNKKMIERFAEGRHSQRRAA